MRKITALIYFGGLVFVLGSFIRYFILYLDYDKVLAYTLLGFLYMGFAMLYEKINKLSATLEGVEEYLAVEK